MSGKQINPASKLHRLRGTGHRGVQGVPNLVPPHWLQMKGDNAIKAHDPKLKVGGPGIASNLSWLDKFLAICQQRELALDFCSWHCYHPAPSGSYLKSFQIEDMLKRHGFTDTENHLGEWCPVKASSCSPPRPGSETLLVDGNLSRLCGACCGKEEGCEK